MTFATAPNPPLNRPYSRPRPAQPLRYDNVPAELRARPQWVVWRYGSTSKRKIPLTPTTGEAASSTDPATWGTFDEAVTAWRRRGYAGIGYVFSADDPYTGIDFDNCIEAGALSPRVASWVAEAGSYAERSPSGAGVKMIVRARLAGPGARNQRLGLEVYDRARFFTLTGDRLDGSPATIAGAQGLAEAVYRAAGGGGANAPGTAASRVVELPDAAGVPSLRPGGPVRRADGTLRRPKPDHWLNRYLTGERGAYERMAAERGWDAGDSGLRFHAIETLWFFGYPEAEIAEIARALLPQGQKNRDTAKWWGRELRDCLYGPKGAATRRPDIARNPTTGFIATSPAPEPERGGRPQAATPDEVLRYYHEEAGKRLLEGPRRRDAEALGISVPTLDRRDAELVARGDITIETLPGRTGRRVTLQGAIKTPPAVELVEVLSEAAPVEAVERAPMPKTDETAAQCIGEHSPEGSPPAACVPPCSAPAALAEPAPPVASPAPVEAEPERCADAAALPSHNDAEAPAPAPLGLGDRLLVARPPRFTPARIGTGDALADMKRERERAATPPAPPPVRPVRQQRMVMPDPVLADLYDLLERATAPADLWTLAEAPAPVSMLAAHTNLSPALNEVGANHVIPTPSAQPFDRRAWLRACRSAPVPPLRSTGEALALPEPKGAQFGD